MAYLWNLGLEVNVGTIPCSCKQPYHIIFLHLSDSTFKTISFLFLILYTLTMLRKVFQGLIAALDKIPFSNFQHICTYLFLFMPKLALSLNNSLSPLYLSLYVFIDNNHTSFRLQFVTLNMPNYLGVFLIFIHQMNLLVFLCVVSSKSSTFL